MESPLRVLGPAILVFLCVTSLTNGYLLILFAFTLPHQVVHRLEVRMLSTQKTPTRPPQCLLLLLLLPSSLSFIVSSSVFSFFTLKNE